MVKVAAATTDAIFFIFFFSFCSYYETIYIYETNVRTVCAFFNKGEKKGTKMRRILFKMNLKNRIN